MHPVARVSTNTLIRTTVRNKIFFVLGGRVSGPKHVVVVHNKIEHEKYFVAYGGFN
jgi:hypothetical protein